MEDAGGQVEVVGIQTGEAQAMNSDVNMGETFTVEKTFSDVSPDDYDALMAPGGTAGTDTLRRSEEAVNIEHGVFEQQQSLGTICYGQKRKFRLVVGEQPAPSVGLAAVLTYGIPSSILGGRPSGSCST